MSNLKSLIVKIKETGFDFVLLPALVDALIEQVQDLIEVVPEAGATSLADLLSFLSGFKVAIWNQTEEISRHWKSLEEICSDGKIKFREAPEFIEAIVGICRIVVAIGSSFMDPGLVGRLTVIFAVMEKIGKMIKRISPKHQPDKDDD